MSTPGIPKDFWNARHSEEGFAHGGRASRLLLGKRLAACKPGGHVFLEGFLPEQTDWPKSHNSGGPNTPDKLFAPDDVRADFAGAESVSFLTGTETPSEGPYHSGPAALLRAVFQKPETE